ncbi:hypothetical protein [uncultured Gammaproteobacteria bacterium]|nr:hypothetical protein [uncultured Gammaproteobacteria bacterium]
MNETQWIFIAIISFALGYFGGYIAKNIGRLIDKLGCMVAIFLPIFLIAGAVQIMDLGSVIISLMFAVGFLFKIFKR